MRRVRFRSEADVPAAIAAVREVITAHEVAAVPTETFYGLAVSPSDQVAVGRIFALKGRSGGKALPVAGASLAQLSGLVVVPAPWAARLESVWPAPLTVVLPTRRPLAAAPSTLAVRVPDHALLRALLAEVGPLTVTSANTSGGAPPAEADDVSRAFPTGLALLLDGGPTTGGAPSTVVDITGARPRLLRRGAWVVPPEWGVEGA